MTHTRGSVSTPSRPPERPTHWKWQGLQEDGWSDSSASAAWAELDRICHPAMWTYENPSSALRFPTHLFVPAAGSRFHAGGHSLDYRERLSSLQHNVKAHQANVEARVAVTATKWLRELCTLVGLLQIKGAANSNKSQLCNTATSLSVIETFFISALFLHVLFSAGCSVRRLLLLSIRHGKPLKAWSISSVWQLAVACCAYRSVCE